MGISNKTFEDVADERDRLRAELAAKDARIAILDAAFVKVADRAEQYQNRVSDLNDEIEALRRQIAFMRGHGIVQDNEALRKRVGELEDKLAAAENTRKLNGALCDLSLANTDSWKARAEQAEAQLAEAKEQAHYANGVAELAMKHRDAAEAQRDAMREALEPFAEMGESLKHTRGTVHMNVKMDWLLKARAALAPPPAGREG